MMFDYGKSQLDALNIVGGYANLGAQQQARQQAGALQQLGQRAFAGDQQALRQGGAISPEWAKKVQDALTSMDDSQRKQFKHKNEVAAQMINGVLSAPPEMRPLLYQRTINEARDMLGPEVVQDAPQQYDQNAESWLNVKLNQTLQANDMITAEQKDLMAEGLERGSPEFQAALKKTREAREKSGGKWTKSDEVLRSVLSMADRKNLTGDKRDQFIYEQLINADPFRIFMREFFGGGNPAVPDSGGAGSGGNPFDQFDGVGSSNPNL